MVLTNTTIDTINYAKDLDIEYHIKLFLLGILFLYSIILLWGSYKWEAEELWEKIIKFFIMRVPSSVFIFFFPFFSIFMFRSASWEIIYGLMISYFTYLFIVIMLAGNFGLFTKLASLLGIETKVKRMEMKQR